jgi:hypothetical protein
MRWAVFAMLIGCAGHSVPARDALELELVGYVDGGCVDAARSAVEWWAEHGHAFVVVRPPDHARVKVLCGMGSLPSDPAGSATRLGDTWHVRTRDDLDPVERSFTLRHELGHVLDYPHDRISSVSVMRARLPEESLPWTDAP